MRVIDIVEYKNADEINEITEPCVESLAQKATKSRGVYPRAFCVVTRIYHPPTPCISCNFRNTTCLNLLYTYDGVCFETWGLFRTGRVRTDRADH